MKAITFALLLLFCTVQMKSETVFGSHIFTVQDVVDLFLIESPNCDTIAGDVHINPMNNGSPNDITNLLGLQNIRVITGDFIISLEGNSVYTAISLLGLSSLEEVQGNLVIADHYEYQNIQSLQGLENLRLCGNLVIQNCYALTTLEPLYALEETGSISCQFFMGIPKSISLQNLFPNLVSIPGAIAFEGASYPEFTGFSNLLSAGSISISGFNLSVNEEIGTFDAFPALQNSFSVLFEYINIDEMFGFEQLQSCMFLNLQINSVNPWWNFNSLQIAQEIQLINELPCATTPSFPSLTFLDPASGGIRAEGLFEQIHFAALQSTGYFDVLGDGFGNGPTNIICPELLQIHGDMIIAHTLVSNLSFLDNVDILGAMVSINGNVNLCTCDEEILCYKVANDPLSVSIGLNAPGCNDVTEVSMNCNLSSAEGIVFIDFECDGVFNGQDYAYPHISTLQNQNGVAIVLVNQNQPYFLPLAQGPQTISLVAPQGFDSPTSYTYMPETQESYFDQNFPLCPEENLFNLSIALIPVSQPRPGFSNSYHVHIANLGVNESGGEITVDFTGASGLSIISASGNGTVNGNVVSWPELTLQAFESVFLTIEALVDTAVPIGQEVTILATVNITSPVATDSYPENNQYSLQQTVIGSYDPNDISVNRENINEEEIINGDPITLEYTIRFQNTGTASAINVRIVNPLDPLLEVASLHVIASSHDYLIELGDDNTLTWKFDNINLPDSGANEPQSHGYIVYSISTYGNLLFTDSISNQAHIFFDYNLPITTNTALTTFYSCPESLTAEGGEEYCEGEEVLFTSNSGYDNLTWNIDGSFHSSGPELQASGLSAGSHSISLAGESAFCTDQISWTITIIPTPATPELAQDGNTITASGSGIFHWQFNGNDLSVSTNSIDITESGSYDVSVTENGCTSAVSTGNFTVIHVDNNNPTPRWQLYPNPTGSMNHVTIINAVNAPVTVRIYDMSSRMVYETRVINNAFVLDPRLVERGMYMVRAYDADDHEFGSQKLVVN